MSGGLSIWAETAAWVEAVRAADSADRPGIFEIYNLQMERMDLSASRQLTALRKAPGLDESPPPKAGP